MVAPKRRQRGASPVKSDAGSLASVLFAVSSRLASSPFLRAFARRVTRVSAGVVRSPETTPAMTPASSADAPVCVGGYTLS